MKKLLNAAIVLLGACSASLSKLILARIPEVTAGNDQLSERSYADIQDIIRAATRVHKGGGNLTPQLKG
ncbi:MAG TPA: hypothetical protein VGI60_09765 [Chthoniobacterales bacterium]|jgi:hypothetical protein